MSTEETSEYVQLARKYAREVFGPIAGDIDKSDRAVTADERLELGNMGFLGIALPEQYGGSDAPLPVALAVIEEFARVCRPAAFQIFESNTGPAQVIRYLGTDDQRSRFLPEIVAGTKTMALGISEPDAGSAATDIRTRGVLDGDHVVLNGSKRWISNGGEADQYLVYCRLDDAPGSRGLGAVVVDQNMAGFSHATSDHLMGMRGIPSGDLYFDDVRVPVANIVVPAGGFSSLFKVFSIERLGNTTMSIAIAQEALDRCLQYVQERQQFGRELVEFQSVQLTLADMYLQVRSARLMRDDAAATCVDGIPDTLKVSAAKLMANEMAKRVTDLAIQLHGGNGLAQEFGIERMHRDAHGWAIAGGTPTMQRIRVVSELLGRRFSQRI